MVRSAGCGLAFLGALVKSLRGKDVVGLAFDQHPCPLLCKNTLEGQRGHQRGKGGEREKRVIVKKFAVSPGLDTSSS